MRRRPLVLIVEDDRALRGLLETLVRAEGYEVAVARDGVEGLLKVRLHAPTALLLDIMMPDAGGFRVLDELAQDEADTPVLVMTGMPDAAAACRERLGAANVFVKPFEVGALLSRLRALIGEGAPDAQA